MRRHRKPVRRMSVREEVLHRVAGGIVEHRALLRDPNDVASVLVRTRDHDVPISNHRG